MPKVLVVSDDSVNSYGFRVLTAGIRTNNFEANPVCFFNHITGDGSWESTQKHMGPIGRWEGIKKEASRMLATPVFDMDDERGATIHRKLENDFIRAASIGFRIIATSNDPELMLPGQRYETVTECELIEISVVDVPANKNALALFDVDGKRIELTDTTLSTTLSALNTHKKIDNKMKISLKAVWTALVAFLGVTLAAGVESVQHDLTDEQLADINAKLDALKNAEHENGGLKAEVDRLKGEVTTLQNDKILSESQNAVLSASINSLTSEKTALGTKVTELEAKLANYPQHVPQKPGAASDGAAGDGGGAEEEFLTDEMKVLHKLKSFKIGVRKAEAN